MARSLGDGQRIGLVWPLAHLAGWTALAVVNGVMLEVHARATIALKWWTILQGGSYVLAAGAVSALTLLGWWRWVRRPAWPYGVGALILAAGCFGVVLLEDDFANFSARALGGDFPVVVRGVLTLLAALLVAAVAFGTSRMRTPWLRTVCVVGAMGVAIGNHYVLPRNYLGLHLYAAWMAAITLGNALARRDEDGNTEAVVTRRLVLVIAGVCTALSVVAIVKPPVRRAYAISDGFAGFALDPFVARLHLGPPPSDGARFGPWFVERDPKQSVAPTEPPLLNKPLIVIYVSIDAVRHELLEKEEYEKRFPTMWKLKKEGVYFENARSPSPATSPTLAAIFTGRYYSQLFWTKRKIKENERKYALSEETRTRFPELLTNAGNRTIHLSGTKGYLNVNGVCAGFATEELHTWRASRILSAMRKHLTDLDQNQGAFLFTHLIEPHAPYQGKAELEPFERYLSEVANVDHQLRGLMAFLRREKLDERTIVILASDHGEAFGEHNTTKHALTVYDELLRVPLIVHGPGVEPRVASELVSLIDLGPTILDLFGVPTPGDYLGQTLVPALRGEPLQLSRPLAAESGRHMRAMVFDDGMKMIFNHRNWVTELYRLDEDPGELTNIFEEGNEDHDERLQKLRSFFYAHEHPGYTRAGRRVPWRP